MDVIAHNRTEAVAALADPMRRQIYDIVAHASEPVGRDVIAQQAGIPRSTAVSHLAKLVQAELLRVESRRTTGRTGPGAGRPAKLYSLAHTEVTASVPERHYELAGELLAGAAERADREGTTMNAAVAAQAHDLGREIGHDNGTLEQALTACGYDPRPDHDGGVQLGNCPFHALAARHTDLVCTANLALVEGMISGTDDTRTPHLVPRTGMCCVEIRRALQDAAAPASASDIVR